MSVIRVSDRHTARQCSRNCKCFFIAVVGVGRVFERYAAHVIRCLVYCQRRRHVRNGVIVCRIACKRSGDFKASCIRQRIRRVRYRHAARQCSQNHECFFGTVVGVSRVPKRYSAHIVGRLFNGEVEAHRAAVISVRRCGEGDYRRIARIHVVGIRNFKVGRRKAAASVGEGIGCLTFCAGVSVAARNLEHIGRQRTLCNVPIRGCRAGEVVAAGNGENVVACVRRNVSAHFVGNSQPVNYNGSNSLLLLLAVISQSRAESYSCTRYIFRVNFKCCRHIGNGVVIISVAYERSRDCNAARIR